MLLFLHLSCFSPLILSLGNAGSPGPLIHLLNKTRISFTLTIQSHHGCHSGRLWVPSSPIDVRPQCFKYWGLLFSPFLPHLVRSCHTFIRKGHTLHYTEIKQNLRPPSICVYGTLTIHSIIQVRQSTQCNHTHAKTNFQTEAALRWLDFLKEMVWLVRVRKPSQCISLWK